MLLIYSAPLWLAFIVWVVWLIVSALNRREPVVQRIVTFPDGKQTSAWVPFIEPAEVTLLRIAQQAGYPLPTIVTRYTPHSEVG